MFTRKGQRRKGQCHSKPYMQITWQVCAISELPRASVLKRVFVQNLSHEEELNFHESESSGGTHFRMNGFARRLVLTQRQNSTGKWPIMTSGLQLILMFKYYFTARIRQWRRHCFVWATLVILLFYNQSKQKRPMSSWFASLSKPCIWHENTDVLRQTAQLVSATPK